MQETIYNFGIQRIQDNEIKSARFCFNLGENENDKIQSAINKIKSISGIDLTLYRQEIIKRENKVGFYLNWHIDDCAVYKHDTTENKTNNIVLNDKYSLYHTKTLPKYTMIIYLTSIDQDFVGGEFEFVDQLIKPKKNDVVFFDSREVHRVRTFRGGNRQNILVKFYGDRA